MRVTAHNRGDAAAPLHVLPQLWARNTWAWHAGAARGAARQRSRRRDPRSVVADFPSMRLRGVHDGEPTLLFCDNDTNTNRLFATDSAGYFKDGINDCIVGGQADAVNPAGFGSKAAAHYVFDIPAGGSATVRVRLRPGEPTGDGRRPARLSTPIVADLRRAECDAF